MFEEALKLAENHNSNFEDPETYNNNANTNDYHDIEEHAEHKILPAQTVLEMAANQQWEGSDASSKDSKARLLAARKRGCQKTGRTHRERSGREEQYTTLAGEISESKNMTLPAPNQQLSAAIWCRTLQMLPLCERLRLQSTCKRFRAACRPWLPLVINVRSASTGSEQKSPRAITAITTNQEEGGTATLGEALAGYKTFRQKNPSRLFEIRLGSGVHKTGMTVYDGFMKPREPGIISAHDIRGFILEGSDWKHLLIRSPYGIAFYGESGTLTYIEIYEGVTTIGEWAFCGCMSLTSVTLLGGVTTIGDYVFNGCSSLTSVTLPEGVTTIGEGAFIGCSSLTSVTLPEGLRRIGYGAFQFCSSLTSVTLPEGVTTIGSYAFWWCSSLTSVTLPEGVRRIGEQAFQGCSSLTSVHLPVGVRRIGWRAFPAGCQVRN